MFGAAYDWYMHVTDYTIKRIKEEKKKEAPAVTREISSAIRPGIKSAFDLAIDKFYADPNFTLVEGGYDRTHGLYELLNTDDESGDASVCDGQGGTMSFTFDYDVNKLPHGLRKSNNKQYIFDVVFDRGYHGGAPDENGTIRYRKPIGSYKFWGRNAVQMTPSPRELFRQNIKKELEEGATRVEIRNILVSHNLAAVRRAAIDAGEELVRVLESARGR